MKRLHTYSQHFLKSPTFVRELIGHSSIKKSDTVVDLGAGSGIISTSLARRVDHVIAVEMEPETLRHLKNNVARESNISVVEADIMEFIFPKQPFKIFSNIPFNLSSPLVRKIVDLPEPPTATYLITQKQFARKLIASDRHFTSQLGAMMYPWFSVKIRRPLRKTDFTPPPAVDTVLLEIILRTEPLLKAHERKRFETFIHQIFETPARYQTVTNHPDLKPSQLTGDELVNLYRERSIHI